MPVTFSKNIKKSQVIYKHWKCIWYLSATIIEYYIECVLLMYWELIPREFLWNIWQLTPYCTSYKYAMVMYLYCYKVYIYILQLIKDTSGSGVMAVKLSWHPGGTKCWFVAELTCTAYQRASKQHPGETRATYHWQWTPPQGTSIIGNKYHMNFYHGDFHLKIFLVLWP